MSDQNNYYEDKKIQIETEIQRLIPVLTELRRKVTQDEFVKGVFDIADNLIAKSGIPVRSSCAGTGCNACCHSVLLGPKAEYEYIVKKAMEKGVTPDLELAKKAALSRDRMGADVKWADKKCPLLIDGQCSIYEDRPLICRYHNSSEDPSKCEKITIDGYEDFTIFINELKSPVIDALMVAFAIVAAEDSKDIEIVRLVDVILEKYNEPTNESK